MRKNLIWVVTIILSFALIGFIFVQLYWIRNAVDINEKQFVQLVNKSLENVVKEIEKREMVYQVINEVDPYNTKSSNTEGAINYHYNQLRQNKYGVKAYNIDKEIVDLATVDSLNFDASLELIGGSGIQLNTKGSFVLSDEGKEELLKKYNFDDRISTKLSQRKVFVESIVNKLIQIDVDIEERIDLETLNEIVEREFKSNGIDLRYEFSVLQNKTEAVYQTANYAPKLKNSVFVEKLYPNDVVSKENYLFLYFPHAKGYIYKSTGLMATNSLVLAIIMIFGFSLSIHIMFKQKKLSVIKNDFVNNMTHELKTPISTISLASQMLKDKSIPVEKKNMDYISNIIDEESKRLSYQVEKVLKTALFDQGKIKLSTKELDVHDVIEGVVKNFDIQVRNKDGVLSKDLKADESRIFADEMHLTNIIFNLLDNAVKYSPETPEITISTLNKNGGIQISVADKGIGIKKQDQKKIFDQFYRVHTGNVHDVKGFGLGLNYVKKIVEEHGGDISLKSEYKKGSKFEIYIPTNHIQ